MKIQNLILGTKKVLVITYMLTSEFMREINHLFNLNLIITYLNLSI